MIAIGLTGVPGSGKTTISRILASKCRFIEGIKNVELVQEYARKYISKHGNIKSVLEQYSILHKQVNWEDSVKNKSLDILISDSPIFCGFVYCCTLPKKSSKELMFFNDIFKYMVNLNHPKPRYDIIFHLNPDVKPVRDGIRPELHFDQGWREEADTMIKATMTIFKPGQFYVIEHKDADKRVDFCLDKIRKHLKKVQ